MEYNFKNKKLFYTTLGEGIPLLVVHGYVLDHTSMLISLEKIFSSYKGFKRIYVDLPLMGNSRDFDVESADEFLEVLISFVNDIIKDEKFSLIGMSYGGYLIRGLAYHFNKQIIGMNMVAPVIYPKRENRELPEEEIIYKDEYICSLAVEELYEFDEAFVILTKELFEFYKEYVLKSLIKSDEAKLAYIQKNNYSFSIDIDKINYIYDFPTIAIVGKNDSVVGYRDINNIKSNYKNLRIHLIDKSGHMLQYENPTLFEEYTSKWLDEVKVYNEK